MFNHPFIDITVPCSFFLSPQEKEAANKKRKDRNFDKII